MDDRGWYVKERVQEAYQFADNQRLAKATQGTRRARLTLPRWLRLIRFIRHYRIALPGTAPQDQGRPAPSSAAVRRLLRSAADMVLSRRFGEMNFMTVLKVRLRTQVEVSEDHHE